MYPALLQKYNERSNLLCGTLFKCLSVSSCIYKNRTFVYASKIPIAGQFQEL